MTPIAKTPRRGHAVPRLSADPQCFIAYAPRGVGLLCAVVYTVRGKDVCGWWAGSGEGEYQTAFFLMEGYFSRGDYPVYATRGGDLYGGWAYNYRLRHPELDEPIAVEDALCHELEHMQFVFAQEWLSFPGDADEQWQNERYHEAELAHEGINLKFQQLDRLDKREAVWTHRSAGADANILEELMRFWPLDCRSLYGNSD